MSLPLRITYKNKDYTYTILSKVVSKYTQEIKIDLEGEVVTLIEMQNKEWDVKERTVSDDAGLIKAIAQNVKLRYRI